MRKHPKTYIEYLEKEGAFQQKTRTVGYFYSAAELPGIVYPFVSAYPLPLLDDHEGLVICTPIPYPVLGWRAISIPVFGAFKYKHDNVPTHAPENIVLLEFKSLSKKDKDGRNAINRVIRDLPLLQYKAGEGGKRIISHRLSYKFNWIGYDEALYAGSKVNVVLGQQDIPENFSTVKDYSNTAAVSFLKMMITENKKLTLQQQKALFEDVDEQGNNALFCIYRFLPRIEEPANLMINKMRAFYGNPEDRKTFLLARDNDGRNIAQIIMDKWTFKEFEEFCETWKNKENEASDEQEIAIVDEAEAGYGPVVAALTAKDKKDTTAYHILCRGGPTHDSGDDYKKLEKFHALLKNAHVVSEPDFLGNNPVHLMARACQYKQKNEADRVNFRKSFRSVLNFFGDELAAELCSQRNDAGRNVLYYLARSGDTESFNLVLDLLVRKRGDDKAATIAAAEMGKRENTVLNVLCRRGDEEMLRKYVAVVGPVRLDSIKQKLTKTLAKSLKKNSQLTKIQYDRVMEKPSRFMDVLNYLAKLKQRGESCTDEIESFKEFLKPLDSRDDRNEAESTSSDHSIAFFPTPSYAGRLPTQQGKSDYTELLKALGRCMDKNSCQEFEKYLLDIVNTPEDVGENLLAVAQELTGVAEATNQKIDGGHTKNGASAPDYCESDMQQVDNEDEREGQSQQSLLKTTVTI